MKKVQVGLIGCGDISPAYLQNLTTHFRSIVDVTACADLRREVAIQRASEFRIPRVCSVDELLADPQIELVMNLTNAWAHYDVNMAILRAGKHLFSEKPLAVTREEGEETLALAARQGVTIAGAADIFLGGALQTCRKLIDEGEIGFPVLANGLIIMNYRHEAGHRRGVGPMFDMGPYYLTAMVALLGPVRRVTGSTSLPFPVKPHPEGTPGFGTTFHVETPMHIAAVLDFANGTLGVVVTSGEDAEGYVPRLEFYGTKATLQANDPNMYYRPVRLRGAGGHEVPVEHGFVDEGRALGVAEQAWAIRQGRSPRASGELMFHVLDIMTTVHQASDEGRHIMLQSTCPRPESFDYNAMMDYFQGAA